MSIEEQPNKEYILAPKEHSRPYRNKLFLAGTIESGTARDWQRSVAEDILSREGVTIYNPRRPAWAGEQRTLSCSLFCEQVLWEQRMLKLSSHVFFNFEPNSISLITMGEFYQCLELKKIMVVCCPKEYRGSGNVILMCALYNVPVYETLVEAVDHMNLLLNR